MYCDLKKNNVNNVISPVSYVLGYELCCSCAFNPPAPSTPPQSVVPVVTSTSSIHLKWRPPASNSINGILTGYVIRYALQGEATQEINLGSSSTRRDFTGLRTYSRYSFAVAAKNSRGSGPFSNTVYATTLSDGESL